MDAVVGVGAGHHPEGAGGRPFPGDEQRDQVGLGAAAGDERVRGGGGGVDEPGQGGRGQLLDHPGRGRLVPGVQGGVQGRPRQVRGDGHGQRRAVQMGDTGGVGRVGRPFRRGADHVRERGLGADALLGQDRSAQGARATGHGLGPPGGQRPAPGRGGGLQRVQDDRGEGPQTLRPVRTARDLPSPCACRARHRRRTGAHTPRSTTGAPGSGGGAGGMAKTFGRSAGGSYRSEVRAPRATPEAKGSTTGDVPVRLT